MTSRATRRVDKKRAAAEQLLGPGTVLRAYSSGAGHARWSGDLTALVGGFVLALVVSVLAFHVFVFPGVLLIVAAYLLFRPRLAIAVGAGGAALLRESIWTGRPYRVLEVHALSELPAHDLAAGDGKRITVALGAERVTVRRADYLRLQQAASELAASSTPGR